MAAEEKAEEKIYEALKGILEIPRPDLRRKILIRAMSNIAKLLDVDLVWKETDGG